jgi:hypothetical protein
MKIEGKMAAEITQKNTKANDSKDGRECELSIAVSVKQEEAVKKWGEEFSALAFSSMRPIEGIGEDEGNALAFLQDKIKPSRKRFIYPIHRIGIDDEVIEAQPELVDIETVDGEARVIAHIKIPVDVGRTKLLTYLEGKVGCTVKIDFAVQQTGFEFKKKPAEAKVANAAVQKT